MYEKLKSIPLSTSSSNLWKVWAEFRSPNDININSYIPRGVIMAVFNISSIRIGICWYARHRPLRTPCSQQSCGKSPQYVRIMPGIVHAYGSRRTAPNRFSLVLNECWIPRRIWRTTSTIESYPQIVPPLFLDGRVWNGKAYKMLAVLA